MLRLIVLGVTLTALASCTGPSRTASDEPDGGGTDGGTFDAGTQADGGNPIFQTRPFALKVPVNLNPSAPVPLVVLFHGYGADASVQDTYFKLSVLADTRTFLLALPNGTADLSGGRFWNATDACCNFLNYAVDDVAYFNAIVDDVQARYNVDPKRIFAIGHSNGGFMAHRLACDEADRLAGIVSLAGASFKNPAACVPSEKVAVLQVHGEQDATISYTGGTTLNSLAYPGAVETVEAWATRNGCDAGLSATVATLDLDSSLTGSETEVRKLQNCQGGAGELWTIKQGVHIPQLNAAWAPAIYDFLMAHPKP